MRIKHITRKIIATASLAGLVIVGQGSANAASSTGWTMPIPPNEDGISFLATSTIHTTPTLSAESTIWTTLGQAVRPRYVGVRARLFKSGVLCESIDYKFNPTGTTKFSAKTSATCGTGWYNSHGFVSVFNFSTGFSEYVTFPSSSLHHDAPPAATVFESPEKARSGRNSKGTFGLANESKRDPDFIAAYASNGKIGYVKRMDLDTQPGAIAVYADDGTTKIGDFRVARG